MPLTTPEEGYWEWRVYVCDTVQYVPGKEYCNQCTTEEPAASHILPAKFLAQAYLVLTRSLDEGRLIRESLCALVQYIPLRSNVTGD